MKKSFFIIGIMFGLFVGSASAQFFSPQVFATSGTDYTMPNVQMSFTIGECLTSSYAVSPTIVTQGFQQPDRGVQFDAIEENQVFVFNVYPNPSVEYIILSYTDESIKEYTIDLIDNLGQIVQTKRLSGNNQQVDISSLAAGNYHLRVTYLKNKTNSFSLVKINNQ